MTRYVATLLVGLSLVILCCQESRGSARYTLITILHTNDLHGRVMPREETGGLARIATLVRQIRGEMPNVLLMDAGDIIHGTPEDYLSGGKASISAMNALSYQLAATGNHEFDFGLEVAKGVLCAAQFPFVAANIRAAGEHYRLPITSDWDRLGQSAVFELGGVRVGVLGLATLDTITLHWPNAIKDISIEDPIETAKKLAPELRERCDVMIVLSHLGDAKDKVLAETVPGIDFIVGGHSHTVIAERRWVGNTLIAQAGSYGRALGRIDFIVRSDESGSRIVSVNGKNTDWNKMRRPPLGAKYPGGPLIPIDDSTPEDEAVRKAYLPFRHDSDRRLSEVIGQAPEAIPGRSAYPDESPAGDLAADAVRAFAGSDVALIDARALAPNGLAAGAVTVRSVYDLIGGYTRQHIVVARVSGGGIRAALDKGFERVKSIGAGISGASITYEVKDGVPVVSELLIGGQPADPERMYTVAAQAYVMMGMMEIAPDTEVISEPAETTREALVSYIRSLGTVTPGPLDRVRREQ